MDLPQRHLDLLERSLTHTLYGALDAPVAPAGGLRQRSLAALRRRGFAAVRLLPGWLEDTLPTVSDRRWALIRLDADMYGSTTEALTNLYPGLSPGGYVIVDDYGAVPACRRAVDDYRGEHGIREPLHRIDWTCAYWRRG